MVRPRSYTHATRAALIHLGGGMCYGPGCAEPVLREVEGDVVLNLQIAHIAAAEPAGPRYDPAMTDDERRSFANLVLLCHPHHTVVDQHPDKYLTQVLHQWKADRESEHRHALAELRQPTTQALADKILDALSQRDAQITQTVERLWRTDRETAQLLAELAEELSDLRRRSLLSADGVTVLDIAASRLDRFQRSGAIEALDVASARLQAVAKTRLADGLREAATALDDLSDLPEGIRDAAQHLARHARSLR